MSFHRVGRKSFPNMPDQWLKSYIHYEFINIILLCITNAISLSEWLSLVSPAPPSVYLQPPPQTISIAKSLFRQNLLLKVSAQSTALPSVLILFFFCFFKLSSVCGAANFDQCGTDSCGQSGTPSPWQLSHQTEKCHLQGWHQPHYSQLQLSLAWCPDTWSYLTSASSSSPSSASAKGAILYVLLTFISFIYNSFLCVYFVLV